MDKLTKQKKKKIYFVFHMFTVLYRSIIKWPQLFNVDLRMKEKKNNERKKKSVMITEIKLKLKATDTQPKNRWSKLKRRKQNTI